MPKPRQTVVVTGAGAVSQVPSNTCAGEIAGVIICIQCALAYRSIPFQGPDRAAKVPVCGFVPTSCESELLYERSKIRLTMVHLPAVITYNLMGSNKFDRKKAPVPPIFQPENSRGRSRTRRGRDASREIGSAIRP